VACHLPFPVYAVSGPTSTRKSTPLRGHYLRGLCCSGCCVVLVVGTAGGVGIDFHHRPTHKRDEVLMRGTSSLGDVFELYSSSKTASVVLSRPARTFVEESPDFLLNIK